MSPVQSGSNRILKLMGRKHTIEEWRVHCRMVASMSQHMTLILGVPPPSSTAACAAPRPDGPSGENTAPEIRILLGGLHDGGVSLLGVLLGEDFRHYRDPGELLLDRLHERVHRGSGGWTACCG